MECCIELAPMLIKRSWLSDQLTEAATATTENIIIKNFRFLLFLNSKFLPFSSYMYA